MRTTVIAAAAAFGLLVPAAVARAGTVALDAACYVEQSTMVASGAGFTPGALVTLSGDGAFATATADAAGSFQVPVQVPLNPSDEATKRSIVTYTLTAQDAGNAAGNTAVQYQVTNFAFRTTAGVSSPRKRRTWTFVGFPVGRTIYAHFRFAGKTRRNFRMGTAAGPCGTLRQKAPLLPVKAVRRGRWTVQVDNARTFRATTQPRIRTSVTVFVTFDPRAARAATVAS